MRNVAASLLCLSLAILTTRAARADDPADEVRAVGLRYDVVPSACPDRTWFEGALHFRSSRVVSVGPDDEAAYKADVKVIAGPKGVFRGSLRITPRGGEETTREIEGTRCQSVVEALGFTIALLLDPEGVNSGTLPSDVELASIAESARAKAAAPPATPPAERPQPPPPPVATPVPASPRGGFLVLAELGGGAWSAVRGVGPRGHVTGEVRWQRAGLVPFGRLGGFIEPAGEATARAGTVSYVPAGGRLDLGLLVDRGAIHVGGGAHVTMLTMPVDAPSADERLPSVRFVPSVGPSLRATWEPTIVGVALEGSGGAYFVRERFLIDAQGTGQEVFRLPAVYAQATIGLIVRFVDPKSPLGR